MKLPLEGSCVCNAIRFEVQAEPLFTHACHCHNCQKITGSAFAMSTFVLNTELQVLAGEPFCIEQPTKSGKRKVFVCPACQTVVFAESGKQSNVTIIRPGVLSNKSDLQPQAHIWAHQRQSWLILDESTPQFDGDYVQSAAWPRSSLAKLKG